MDKIAQFLLPRFQRFCVQIHNDLQNELQTPRFESGFIVVTTVRQSGEIVQETRNIVDTKELLNSQQLEVNGLKAKISYNADHAPEVYFLTHGGRPWVERYVSETGESEFREKFKQV